MKNPCLIALAMLGLAITPELNAQAFSTLYSFTNGSQSQVGGLVVSGSTLYGTTHFGGSNNTGAVFSVSTNGSNFTTLHSFAALVSGTNRDGANLSTGLLLSGNTLYGTANNGGSNGNGTVFAVSTTGSNFTTLHSFTALVSGTNRDGANPNTGLILSDNALYGTANDGGTNGYGVVFKVNADGTGFTNLHSFTIAYSDAGFGPLTLLGDTLYGTTVNDGANGEGTVFALNTNGSAFTNLYSFTASESSTETQNSDGANPFNGFVLAGNTLYGTGGVGGTNGEGTVFAIATNGSLTTLYDFGSATNDGAYPEGGLFLSGNTLYGTTTAGGSNGFGTVFAIETNGMGYNILYNFSGSTNGSLPVNGVVLSGNTLYGTTFDGGRLREGAVFSLSLGSGSITPPSLTLTPAGGNVILTWPTNATGFTLEFTTNLVSPAVWSTVSGKFAVTNPVSGTQKFYRLSQ